MTGTLEELVPAGAVGFVLYSFADDESEDLIDNDGVMFATRAALVDVLRAATSRGGVEVGASIPALIELLEESPMPNHFASLTDEHGETVAEVALDAQSFAYLLGVVDALRPGGDQ